MQAKWVFARLPCEINAEGEEADKLLGSVDINVYVFP